MSSFRRKMGLARIHEKKSSRKERKKERKKDGFARIHD